MTCLLCFFFIVTRKENIKLPHVEDILLPPPYVVRLVLVYGRSNCMPQVSTQAKQVWKSLLFALLERE